MRIELNDVRKSYGSRVVLGGVTATFQQGEVTAVVGPSGSGKSTLLATVAGFERLDSGSVEMITDERAARLRPREIAWIPQGSNSIPARTVLDNAMVGALARGVSRPAARKRADAALDAVGLTELALKRARTLSGGELQRACFARAIASGAPCIFADEPSASLDALSTERLAAILRDLKFAGIVVVATHDPVMISSADAIFDMRSVIKRRT
jgi:ABC-type lipoprotein export system ATPase subunit